MVGLSSKNTIRGFGFSVCANDRLWITDRPKFNPTALSTNNSELEGCSFSKSSRFTPASPLSEFCYIFPFLTSRRGGLCFPLVYIPTLRIGLENSDACHVWFITVISIDGVKQKHNWCPKHLWYLLVHPRTLRPGFWAQITVFPACHTA